MRIAYDFICYEEYIKAKRTVSLYEKQQKEKDKLPEYVRMGTSNTVLQLQKAPNSFDGSYTEVVYHREVGLWDVNIRIKHSKLYTDSDIESLDNVELFPASREEWEISNYGYVKMKVGKIY